MVKLEIFAGHVVAQGSCALIGVGNNIFGAGMVAGTAIALVLAHFLERK